MPVEAGLKKKKKPECWRFSIRSRLFACHQVTLMKAAAMDDPGPEEGHALTTSAETDISFFKMALSHLRSDPHAETAFLLLSLKLAENNFFFLSSVLLLLCRHGAINARTSAHFTPGFVCLSSSRPGDAL